MFYSENILVKKGPLANVWLAANWDRKLSKTQILHTDITGTVQDLVSGDLPPMALRLSGQLLLGVSKIYGRQAKYLLEDCGEALSRFQETKPAAANNITESTEQQKPKLKAQELLAKQEQEEEAEFNVEEFLKAVPATKMSLTPSKRVAEEPISESNLLSPAANADLLKALQIEGGRLMSDHQFSPLPEGVEVGRRASDMSAVRDSLPLSPLRSPLGVVGEEEPQINGDDFGLALGDDGDYAPLGADENAAPISDNALQLPISPPQSAAKRPRRRPRSTTAAAPAVVMDEETELSQLYNSLPQIAVQKRNAKSKLLTLLNRTLASEDAFADLFNDIALSSPHKNNNNSIEAMEKQQQEEMEITERLVNEEQMQFGGEEMAVSLIMEDADYVIEPEQPIVSQTFTEKSDFEFPSLPFNLQAYMSGVSRRRACQIFFKVLSGCTNGEFRAEQTDPFTPITISQ